MKKIVILLITLSGLFGQWKHQTDPTTIRQLYVLDQNGLKQVTDTTEIENIVDEVINENQKMVEQYLAGKNKLLGFFVGQSMKKSKGKANPKILNDILKYKLSKKN